MEPIDIGVIIVALTGAFGSWAAQRSAQRAANQDIKLSSRLEAESEAYDRARAFDTETILRQNKKIDELHEENARLHKKLESVMSRLATLERLYPNWERELHDDR